MALDMMLLGLPDVDDIKLLSTGLAFLRFKLHNLADTAPLRLGIFRSYRIFADMGPELLRAGDGAVIGGVDSLEEVRELVFKYGISSRGPPRRSQRQPRGPFHLILCSKSPDIQPMEGSSLDDVFSKICIFDLPKEIDSFRHPLFSKGGLDSYAENGFDILEVPASRGGYLPEGQFVQVVDEKLHDEITHTSIMPWTISAISSRINLSSLRMASKRFYQKYGSGGFHVHYASMEACQVGCMETIEETIKRLVDNVEENVLTEWDASLSRPMRRGDVLARRREILAYMRKEVAPVQAAVFEGCLIYKPMRVLEKLCCDKRRISLVTSYMKDNDHDVLICSEVYVGQEKDRSFQDTLVDFCVIGLDDPGVQARATAAVAQREEDQARRAAEQVKRRQEEREGEQKIQEEQRLVSLAVELANERARLEKADRRRRCCGQATLLQPHRDVEPQIPEIPEMKIVNQKPKKNKKGATCTRHQATRLKEENEKQAKLLSLVQAHLGSTRDGVVEEPDKKIDRVPKRKVASKVRQARLTLSLQDFCDAA